MAGAINRKEIADGVFFSKITDDKYKVNCVNISFLSQLKKDTVSDNAVVPRILTYSNSACPDPQELSCKLSNLYAASLGSTSAKMGDTQYMCVTVSALDDKYALEGEKVLDEATDILLDSVFKPLTDGEAFDKKVAALQKQAVIDDIMAELNEKRTYAVQRAFEILCEGEGAALGSNGSVETAQLITEKTAFDAYKKMLASSPVEIICIGCNDFDIVEQKLTKAFKALERSDIETCVSEYSKLKAEAVTKVDKLKVSQSKMVLGMKTDSRNYADTFVMSKIYGGTTTSKLFMNVREKLSLCYYCWSKLSELKGLMLIDCGIENSNIDKARAEILAQFEDMKSGKFSDEDITTAKITLENDLKTVNDSPSALFVWYLSHIYKNNIVTPEQEIEKYRAVTREGIIEAAKAMKLDSVYVLTSEDEGGNE